MSKLIALFLGVLTVALLGGAQSGCEPNAPVSASGLKKAEVKVPVGSDGFSIEQRNVRDRVMEDNKPGSIKHLYIISAYSGQTILYSTVRGKVTSSGKRLAPREVTGSYNQTVPGFALDIDGRTHYTNEILQDDGTYGSSVEYLFWFDSKGIYHQHYPAGGQIIHVSGEPIAVKSVVINLEMDTKAPASK